MCRKRAEPLLTSLFLTELAEAFPDPPPKALRKGSYVKMSGINAALRKIYYMPNFIARDYRKSNFHRDCFSVYFYFNKVHIVEVQLDGKIFLSQIQNRW